MWETQRNSVWLSCGDCRKILKEIPDSSVDLVVTDPPYLLNSNLGGANSLIRKRKKLYGDLLGNMADGFDTEIIGELVRVMKKVNIYIFCSKNQIYELLTRFTRCTDETSPLYHKIINFNLLCWHKTNPIPACGNTYLSDTEYILYFRERGVKLGGSYHTKKTYYVTQTNKADRDRYNHPTCKPVMILENLIENSSNEGEVVLDPFMGSGSTGEACIRKNRKFIGIEIDESYMETSRKRLSDAFISVEVNKGDTEWKE